VPDCRMRRIQIGAPPEGFDGLVEPVEPFQRDAPVEVRLVIERVDLERVVIRVQCLDVTPERVQRDAPVHQRLRVRRVQRQRTIVGLKRDRKSTRLNSSHVKISYAVFCLKKKMKTV